jgi:uncharacterized protein DUF1707
MSGFWEAFEHDPRRPENAPLRAADRDRSLVQDLLGTAFAEGRLTREELDERTDALVTTRMLGALPPLVRDLVAPSTPAPRTSTGVTIRAEAEDRYRRMRNQALMSFLTPTLICWAIWVATLSHIEGFPFPWPVFVTIVTGLHWVRLVTRKEETIASLERKGERREQRRLEAARRHEQRRLGRPSYPPQPYEHP